MEAESSAMAAGRQIRQRKKRKVEPPVEPETTGSRDSPTEGIESVKPVKRSRKTAKLANLISMPLDILFEIFGHLLPYDLLKLARITKDFRRVLMHRSSMSVWKSARQNIPDLPQCPPEMSEPAWANLAFYPHCHYCFVHGVRNAEWTFRVRICSKCAKDHLVESTDYDSMCDLFGSMHFHLLDNVRGHKEPNFQLLVPTRQTKKSSRVFLREQVIAVKAQYKEMGTENEKTAFIVERKKLVADLMQHAKMCEIWAKNQTSDRTEELQQLREERRTAIIKKLEGLGWGDDLKSISYPDSLSDQKFVNKPQRLTERIWLNIKPAAIQFMEKMRGHRLDRERAALVVSRKVFANDVLRMAKNRLLPCMDFLPESPDFCSFPLVAQILEQPSEVDVNESSFDGISTALPDIFKTWRETNVEPRLLSLMRMYESRSLMQQSAYCSEDLAGSAGNGEDIALSSDAVLRDKMTLAVTVFQCLICRKHDPWSFSNSSDDDDGPFNLGLTFSCVKPLFYPQVLGHACLTRDPFSIFIRSNDPSKYLQYRAGARMEWDHDGLDLDPSLSVIASQIVILAGLDPELATADDMDQLPVRFKCRDCVDFRTSQGGDDVDTDEDAHVRYRPIYNWRSAITHQGLHHRDELLFPFSSVLPNESQASDNLQLLSDDELADASFEENVIFQTKAEIWNCAHCRDLTTEVSTSTLPEISRHIEVKHDKTCLTLNEDYFKNFSAQDLLNTAQCTAWIPTSDMASRAEDGDS